MDLEDGCMHGHFSGVVHKDGTEGIHTYDYTDLSLLSIHGTQRLVLVSTCFALQKPSEYRELFVTG